MCATYHVRGLVDGTVLAARACVLTSGDDCRVVVAAGLRAGDCWGVVATRFRAGDCRAVAAR